jgi:hypothetical protein
MCRGLVLLPGPTDGGSIDAIAVRKACERCVMSAGVEALLFHLHFMGRSASSRRRTAGTGTVAHRRNRIGARNVGDAQSFMITTDRTADSYAAVRPSALWRWPKRGLEEDGRFHYWYEERTEMPYLPPDVRTGRYWLFISDHNAVVAAQETGRSRLVEAGLDTEVGRTCSAELTADRAPLERAQRSIVFRIRGAIVTVARC